MAKNVGRLALVGVCATALAVPLIYAQSGTTSDSSRGYGQTGQMGMGMGHMGGIAVDNKYIYVMMNGGIARLDKNTGQMLGTLALYSPTGSWADESGSLQWNTHGNLRSIGDVGGSGGTTSGATGTTSGATGTTSGTTSTTTGTTSTTTGTTSTTTGTTSTTTGSTAG